jgi:4-hydroxy-tetrahydrodipicolinate synthase
MAFDLTKGIIAAPVTPFNEDESVDWRTFESYMAQIAEAGPAGIALNMAAGEGGSLERDEQLEAVKRAKKVAAGATAVVSGVLAPATNQAVRKARDLADTGADALVVFPVLPTFASKPISVSMVVDYHAAIANAVQIPVIAFQTSLVTYPKGVVTELAKIKNIVAIKDAAFDIDTSEATIAEARATNGGISVLTGNDTFILEAMLMGSAGALIGFAGTATAELIRMQKLAADRKITEAYEIWDRLAPIAKFCWGPPLRDYRVRMKYVLLRQGVIPNAKARLPQPPVSESDRKEIDRLFDKYGYADARYRPAGAKATRLRSVV